MTLFKPPADPKKCDGQFGWEGGGQLPPSDPALFAALFLLSVTGIVICLLLDAVLRHWYEGASEEVQE